MNCNYSIDINGVNLTSAVTHSNPRPAPCNVFGNAHILPIDTTVGQSRLRADMLNAGCIVMPQPEAYLKWKPEAFAVFCKDMSMP